MAFNQKEALDQRPQAGFPMKQQLRESDAMAYAKRMGVKTGSDLLQEHEEFRAAIDAQDAQAARPSPRKSCKEIAEFVKTSALVDSEKDEADLKAVLIAMLAKINRLE